MSPRRRSAVLLLVIACGCDSEQVEDAHHVPAPPSPLGMPSARRPDRVYYYARTGDRCEVFWMEGEDASEPETFPCSRDVLSGERIRLSGMTCIRESPSHAERQVPVVCPDPLTNREKWDLAPRLDAGP